METVEIWSEFRKAILNSDLQRLDELVKEGFDINVRGEYENAPLILALKNYNSDYDSMFEVLTKLIDLGADVAIRNGLRRDPFDITLEEISSLSEQIRILDKLINSSDLSINSKIFYFSKTVEYAIKHKKPEIIYQVANDEAVQLHACASAANQETVRYLIDEKGIDINIRDEHGETALTKALKYKKEKIAKELIRQGIKVDIENNKEWTQLLYAIKYVSKEVIEKLKEKGAELDDINMWIEDTPRTGDLTLLMIAAKYNEDPEVAEMLIKDGAELNIRNENALTPLMLASRYNNKDVTRVLIEHGAEINATNEEGLTSLMIAINSSRFRMNGNIKEVVATLIKNGADINITDRRGWTPLMLAVSKNGSDREIVNILIEHGADVNAINEKGESVFEIANFDEASPAIVMSLIKNGAKFNSIKSYLLTSIIDCRTDIDKLKIIDKMAEQGIDFNVIDVDGNTPLSEAAYANNVELINKLIECGADVDFMPDAPPLMKAAEYNSIDAVDALVKHGADVNIQNSLGLTPLMIAGEFYTNLESTELITKLVELGADVNAKDQEGVTALMTATKYADNLEAINVLLENGADPSLEDKKGNKAIDYLEENEYLDRGDDFSELKEKLTS